MHDNIIDKVSKNFDSEKGQVFADEGEKDIVINPKEILPASVFLVTRHYLNRFGGAERVLTNVANGLNEAGFDVTICCYDPADNGDPFYDLSDYVHVLNLGVHKKPSVKRRGGTKSQGKVSRGMPMSYIFPFCIWAWSREHSRFLKALKRCLGAYRPDLVIAFQPNSTTEALMAGNSLGIPVIASFHNVPEQDFNNPERWDPNPWDRYLRKKILKKAAGITVLLDEFKDWFPKKIRDKVHVIPNAVQVSGPPASPGVNNDIGKNSILALGRIAPAKDFFTLARAWAEIADDYPGWEVKLFGNGPLEKDLKKLVRELKIQKSFHVFPKTRNIIAEYEMAKIFCIPSVFEGFGLVTAEALKKGLPAIGFADCPGTNTLIINEHNGLLVDGDERVKNLAGGLRHLIENPSFRQKLGANGPKSVEQYSGENIMEKWLGLINGFLERTKKRG